MNYPFVAVVGQETMKRALLLNIVNPDIGGVLIRGEKGTGKSLCVRGLTELLPDIDTVLGCRYNCEPTDMDRLCSDCAEKARKKSLEPERRPMRMVNLPLNVTEDRLVGSIDIEKVLSRGQKAVEMGLLAEAHRGILYIDEINLLDDNIVDVLLDAAAMGVVTVEREGISLNYPSRFIMVGSMNPEEGELRPQLLDRLALVADVKGLTDPEQRVSVMVLREEFSKDPDAFIEKYRSETLAMKRKVAKAREVLPSVKISQGILETIARVAVAFGVDGHRADIIIERTARTAAAFDGRTQVEGSDLVTACELALPHRMRRQPFEEGEFSRTQLHNLIERFQKET